MEQERKQDKYQPKGVVKCTDFQYYSLLLLLLVVTGELGKVILLFVAFQHI